MYSIEILGNFCKADKALIPTIKPCLKYPKQIWRKGEWAMVKTESFGYMIDGRNGMFLSGLLPRVEKFLTRKRTKYKTTGDVEYINYFREPYLIGQEFRGGQLEAIQEIITKQRGVIHFATGYGKTSTVIGLVNAYYDTSVLYLVHRKELLYQTRQAFINGGYDISKLGIVGDGKKELDNQITIATHQTLSKMNLFNMADWWDIVIGDECHRCSDLNKNYGKILYHVLAPIRVGLTATRPETIFQRLTMEGLFGPVIAKVKISEGQEEGVLAEVKTNLISIPYRTRIQDKRSYTLIYRFGIVRNKYRNRKIIKLAMARTKKKKSVLIMVDEIEHGERLLLMAKKLNMKGLIFLQGETPVKTRNEVAKKLRSKKVLAVMTTNIWKEGIDIPSLDVFINACGGKGEVKTLQSVGRVLRATEDKTKVEIIDFLDPYRYLAEHSIKRLQIYRKEKLL